MIGGNTNGTIQIKTAVKNAIGESAPTWENVQVLEGWLDLMSGDSKYTSFNTKIKESTHVFVGDYQKIDERVKEDNSRMIINSQVYDITLIDNPMGLNRQIEIYLTFTGGQS